MSKELKERSLLSITTMLSKDTYTTTIQKIYSDGKIKTTTVDNTKHISMAQRKSLLRIRELNRMKNTLRVNTVLDDFSCPLHPATFKGNKEFAKGAF